MVRPFAFQLSHPTTYSCVLDLTYTVRCTGEGPATYRSCHTTHKPDTTYSVREEQVNIKLPMNTHTYNQWASQFILSQVVAA